METESKLKQLRIKSGLTQMELAKESGVSQKTISAIEVGTIEHTTYTTAVRLSKVLGCKPEVLLTTKEGDKPEEKEVSTIDKLKARLSQVSKMQD